MQSKFGGGLLIALAILAGLAITLAALHWFLPDAGRFKGLAGIAQSIVTVLAIIIGGIIAAYKLQLFRDFEPHLTISHAISHRPVGNGYIHIAVKAVLHNSSRVEVKLKDGWLLIQHITTMSDDPTSENPSEPQTPVENFLYPQWPTLDESSFDLGDHEIAIEPGQTIQEVLQFMVPDGVDTVLICYFFHDSRFPENPLRGWGITDVYDIISE